jgi:hypothetical protein
MTYRITRTDFSKLIFSYRTALTIFLLFWVLVLVAQSPCPTDSVPKVTPSVTAPFCKDSASGSIVLSIKPDSFTYKFKWIGANGFKDSIQNLNNILSGNYQVTIINARNLCDTVLQITVPIGRDSKLPRVKCKDATIYLDAKGIAILTPDKVNDGTTDNCSPPQLFLSKTDFNCLNIAPQTAWLIAVDAAGNRDSCEAGVLVKDTIPPQLNCKNTTIFINNIGKTTLNAADVVETAADNCTFNTTLDQTAFDCTQVGQNTVKVTATDASSNTTQCSPTVFIRDTIKPVIACKNTTVYVNNTGNAVLNIDSVKASAGDNCALDTFILSKINFSCLNIGSNEVTLTAKDKSGNTSSCKAPVTVKDTIPPSVICPQNMVKNLASGECSANINFSASATDNCSAVVQQIAGLPSGTAFSIGDTRIAFKATDNAGNTSTCSFNISVREYPATGSMSCTSQITVSLNQTCEQFIDLKTLLLGQNYGCFNRYTLELYDQSLRLPDNYVRSAQIARPISYKITDSQTLNFCSGNIAVVDNLAPIIRKPIDVALSCYQVPPIANPLPAVTGEPEVISDCSNRPTTINYSDESFQAACATPFTAAPVGFPSDITYNTFLARNCSRIIVRSFTITDFYGNSATCKQAIYIRNSDIFDVQCPSGFNIKCTGLPPNLLPDSALIQGVWVAGTGRPQLPNGMPISPNNIGSTNSACRFYATYSDFRRNLENGSYFIDRTWTISNECTGENRICVQSIGIEDGLPYVTCRAGFKTHLKEDKTVRITAADLIASTFDKCTPLERMQTRIRRVGQGIDFPDSTFLIFSCDHIGIQQVEIWVKDETGNTASCTTSFEIGDVGKYCSPPPPLSISGKFVRENRTDLAADALLYNLKDVQSQTANPHFNFENLKQAENYRLEAQRPADWINGVTTFDIVLFSKHILGYEYLNSPYKRIAADVNRDGEVNSADMLLVRRLILRQLDSVPNNRPWCFVPVNHVFPDPENPTMTPFAESYTFNALKDSIKNADFIGIKIGDLNLTARASTQSEILEVRGEPFIFKTDNIFIDKNEKKTVVLTPSVEWHSKGIAAFQCTFNFNENINIEKVEAVDSDNFTPANYHILNNKIAVSWNGNTPPQLKITFRAYEPVFLNKILSITSDMAAAEAYTAQGDIMPVALQFSSISTSLSEKNTEKGLVLYQNAPNPFREETVISFYLPQSDRVVLSIFDLTGKVLKTVNGTFNEGINHIKLLRNDLPTEGVYLYSLDTPSGILTRKMALVKLF